MNRPTHTYVRLGLSKLAYDEIKKKLEEAGYQHCFIQRLGKNDPENPDIDMHGLAVVPEGEEE